jgi:hypothetical protein
VCSRHSTDKATLDDDDAGPLQPSQPRDGEADVDDEFDVLVETAIREHASPHEASLGSPADTPRTAVALLGVDELLANLFNQVAVGQAVVSTFAKNLGWIPPIRALSVSHSKSVFYGDVVWARMALTSQNRRFSAPAEEELHCVAACQ